MVSVAQNQSRRPRPITIDTETGVVAPDRIFIHRSTKGYVCVGIGAGGALLERAARTFDLPVAKLTGRTRAPSNDLYLERLTLLAKGYNPDEARVPAGNTGAGEWTFGGAVASAASAATSLFETDSASVVAGLATIGSRLSAPAAFLGTLFIPTNRSPISSGTLPSNPDVSYRFDSDTGTLTLTRSDGTVLFSDHHGAGGVFRDSDGNAIGRMVDGALVLDPDALPGYAMSSKPSAQSALGVRARAQTDTDRGEPELCPDPSPENTNGRKERALRYQEQVTGLPRAFDVQLNGVRFDGCNDSDGTMLEAKGPGYQRALRKPTKFPWRKMQIDMLKQASRQVAAARGRPIEWHFAEDGVANYMRTLFAERGFKISVIYTPPQ